MSLHRAGDEEVLLLEPQLLALRRVVDRVEHLGDVLRGVLLLDGADVVAVVEDREVELLAGARAPEAHGVDGVVAVAGDRRVVGDAEHRLRCRPSARGSRPCRRLTSSVRPPKLDRRRRYSGRAISHGLPKRSHSSGRSTCVPSRIDLVEDAELVADAVAVAGLARASPSSRGSRRRAGRGRRCRGRRRPPPRGRPRA